MAFKPPKQELTSLAKAIVSLDKLHQRVADEPFMASLDSVIRLGLQAGLIQNFEFTYELSWKAMRRWLKNNVNPAAVDGVSRRELFRLAAENRLITDVNEWMTYHTARNQTSHQYDNNLAEETLALMADFVHAAQYLLSTLEAHND